MPSTNPTNVTGREALVTAASFGRALFDMRNAPEEEQDPSDEADMIKLVLDRGLVAETKAAMLAAYERAQARGRRLYVDEDYKPHLNAVADVLRDRYDIDISGEVLDLLDLWRARGADVDFM